MSMQEFIISGGEQILLSISPDWPMIIVTGLIGIGSILTSVLVGKISKQNQQAQNLAKKAELRQQWINELRDSLSEFISLAGTISVRRNLDNEFASKEIYYQYHSQLLTARTRIYLMLDPEKDYTLIIKSLISDVYSEAVSKTGKVKELSSYRKALEEQSQVLLEKAWNDIKSELK
ncbi:hypothetical protein [Aliivibrio fischeri]|uniref:hypothetical protein n=1 Tax=Aliivibrio fischeri TaxID=668 RepID=UPI0012DAB78A|nr:hypothetical protein [Aliivibrio fischeri]MUJ26298.1 hypothetical protein [Aliivibrio fischeri]